MLLARTLLSSSASHNSLSGGGGGMGRILSSSKNPFYIITIFLVGIKADE